MTLRDLPPFRADHVGSLLRPKNLLDARARHAAGRSTTPSCAGSRTRRSPTSSACRPTSGCGRRPTASSAGPRGTWTSSTRSTASAGSPTRTSSSTSRTPTASLDYTPAGLHVDGRCRSTSRSSARTSPTCSRSWGRGRRRSSPSPRRRWSTTAAARPRSIRSVYPDEDSFWDDLSAAYAQQVQGIAAQGCTYLQLDDTSLAYLNDPAQRAELAAQGRDAEHQHERYIRQINAALAGRPDSLTVTTHMCRGNYRSSWVAEGGYDFVAEALFGGLEVDGFFLEYDDARSGGFEPLRFVPPGKRVVLGLVTTKRPQLESKDDLKRRIDEAAKFVPLEQLACRGSAGSPRPSRATP